MTDEPTAPDSASTHNPGIVGGQGFQVGDRNVQFNLLFGGRKPVGAVVAGEIPQSPRAFQPRAGLLAALEAGGPGVSVVRAVTGMRGVGKTQVAAAYARSCIDAGWRLVAWVNAEDTTEMLNGLAVVADRLGIRDPDADLEVTGVAVRNHLEADGERCLVVFDNVDDPDGLRRFLPAEGKSRVIVTSAGQAAAGVGRLVAVDVFSEPEALAFLAERTGRPDPRGAAEVARELGFLPLALAQAAAVVDIQRLAYPVYLDRLRSLPVREYLVPSPGEPYPHGVAETVLLSLDAVAAADRTGLCRSLLEVVSLLSTAGVPRALLYTAGASVFSPPFTEESRLVTEQKIDEALGRLAAASLLTFSIDGSTVSAHRLIMRVARERLAHDGTLAALGSRICDLLSTVAQSVGEPWQNQFAARDTVQQVIALHEHLAAHLHDDEASLAEDMLMLRIWSLECMNKLGDSIPRTIKYGEQIVAECDHMWGESDPDTLIARNSLATAYRAAGRPGEAIPLLERTLASAEQVLGESGLTILTYRQNLSLAYLDAGRLAEAAALLERILTDARQAQGESHPDNQIACDNLGITSDSDRRLLALSIPLVENMLAEVKQMLGESRLAPGPQSAAQQAPTATTRPAEEIPLIGRMLAEAEQVLGDIHPDTLATRSNLASAYLDAGRLAEAISLYERTLTGRVRVLGDTHPDTLATRNDLAQAHELVQANENAGLPAPGIDMVGAERGCDVETEITFPYTEAALGATVPIRVSGEGPCGTCEGTGAAVGASRLMCPTCSGSGRNTSTHTFKARIPPGIKDGQRLRIKGKGAPGKNGGPVGDLYVRVHLKP